MVNADTRPAQPHDDDAAHLARLGYSYDAEFKRDMGFWGNVALGFTYLSPVVGVYTTLSLSLAIAGPPAVWVLLLAGVGQFLVALVFGEVVSNFPVAGGVYPWARRLWGRKYAWLNGWVYAMALCVTIAAVAYGAGPFLGAMLGLEMSPVANVLLSIGVIVAATFINLGGTRLLSAVAFFGFVAEIVATIAIGGWLLVGARKHDLSILFQDIRPADMQSAEPFVAAFAASAIMGIFLYYGFEACGDVAEEVKNPGRTIPRAMRSTIYIGGAAATFVAICLVLAIPDPAAILRGEATDPIGDLFLDVFGPVGFRVVMAVVLVSFLSCVISLQAAASRLLYSMGRDRNLPGSRYLSRFDERLHVPPYALVVAAAIPIVVVLVSLVSENALTAIVSFASLGVYIGFQMVVLAALRARLKGWRPEGRFTMGRWGVVVNVLALCWGLFGMTVLAWPVADAPWYDAWLVLLSAAVVVGVGLVYLVVKKPYLNSDAPAGDAHTGVLTAVPAGR